MRSFISFSVIPYVQCSYISTSIQYGDFKTSKQHYCEKWKQNIMKNSMEEPNCMNV